MTINELITFLSKFDGNLEVVSAVHETAYDRDAYSEDILVGSINESDFEVDDHYSALVFKADGCMPERWDWDNSYRNGIPWKKSLT